MKFNERADWVSNDPYMELHYTYGKIYGGGAFFANFSKALMVSDKTIRQ